MENHLIYCFPYTVIILHRNELFLVKWFSVYCKLHISLHPPMCKMIVEKLYVITLSPMFIATEIVNLGPKVHHVFHKPSPWVVSNWTIYSEPDHLDHLVQQPIHSCFIWWLQAYTCAAPVTLWSRVTATLPHDSIPLTTALSKPLFPSEINRLFYHQSFPLATVYHFCYPFFHSLPLWQFIHPFSLPTLLPSFTKCHSPQFPSLFTSILAHYCWTTEQWELSFTNNMLRYWATNTNIMDYY